MATLSIRVVTFGSGNRGAAPIGGSPSGHPESFYAEITPAAFGAGNTIEFNIDAIGEVDWGDGSFVPYVANTDIESIALSPGPVVVKSVNSPTYAQFSPSFSRNANCLEINIINSSTLTNGKWIAGWLPGLTTFTIADASNITTMESAFQGDIGASSLTSFTIGNNDISSCINFNQSFIYCDQLLSFPAINMSTGEDYTRAWKDCSSLSSFPLIDISSTIVNPNNVNLTNAWEGCTGLTTFPELDFSDVKNFTQTWLGCSNIASMPAINSVAPVSAVYIGAFEDCTSLVCLTSIDTTNIISTANASGMFTNTPLLVAPTAGEITSLTTLPGLAYVNGSPCP